jgi:6-phospho-beta-glucosidase
MGVKVAVIGGGSTYTPELIDGLAQRSERLRVDELVLHDIDADRLEVVAGMARRMLRRLDWSGRLTATTSVDEAIDQASFVLLQLRVGGQAARLVDETLPLRFGTIGQETTGAGGFAKALRTVPVVLGIADQVARRSVPDAWIVDFTNPVGIVTQALIDVGHRAIGLCNVGIGFQRRFAEALGVEPADVQLEHIGLNHLSWIRGIRVQGTDRLDEILDRVGPELARDIGLPLETLRELRAVPSYYLRYYYQFDEVLAEQRSKPSRAQEVMDIEASLLEMYRDPAVDTKPELLEHRGGAYYSLAAAQLLASLHDGRGDVQVVDVRNGGLLPELADDDVIEVSARIDREGAHPVAVAPLDPAMLELVKAVKHFERLVIRAAMSGERADALVALSANPLVGPHIDPEPLLDALLEANRALLPRFFRG